MKKIVLKVFLITIISLCFTACADKTEDNKAEFHMISSEEAKKMMDEGNGYLIIDVRRSDEYESGHIPNAINIPNEVIAEEAEDKLKDKDQLLLIYCRSGRRSKEAAQKLVDLGYTNVYEFGGILDWPYGTES